MRSYNLNQSQIEMEKDINNISKDFKSLKNYIYRNLKDGKINLPKDDLKELQLKLNNLYIDVSELYISTFDGEMVNLFHEIKDFKQKYEDVILESMAIKRHLIKNKKALYKNIGEKIKRIRKFKGISQFELAERSKLSQALISRIERGCESMRVKALDSISDALDIDLCMLICKKED